MAQLNDLIVTGKARFLNIINGSINGNAVTATTASKLGSSTVGSATQPIYLSAGTATACTHTLGVSVPSGAVFTDTKVTAVGNHYTPTKSTSKDASGGTLTDIANSSTGTQVVTGVEMDAAGHVTGVKSVALKATNSTYTVNNGTLTVKRNSVSAGTFTANQSSASNINIDCITAVSGTSGVSAATALNSTTGVRETTVKAALNNYTKSSLEATAMGSTANRQYAVGLDSNGDLSVNIPWTNNAVTQTETTTNANYELLFSGTADDTNRTEGAGKSSKLKFNPSTNSLIIIEPKGQATLTPNQLTISGASGGQSSLAQDSLVLSHTGVSTTYSYSDIETDGHHTWDGTNTSLKTAVSSKLNKAGDTMTGALTFNKVSNAIHYTGSKADYTMIQFIDNTSDTYGNGIAIGGGGQAIIGGGESSSVMKDNAGTAGAEEMWIGNDGDVHIYTNLQNGWANRNDFQFTAGKNIFLPSGGGLYFPNDGIINFQANTTSETTGDICWSYSNTKEKARIWCDGSFTSGAGLYYRCYNSSGTQLFSGRLQVTGTSDIRLKKNVKDTNINNALDIINQIKMRQFDWKNTDEHQDIGFIADELEELDKNFVDKGTGGLDKFGEINPKSVNTFYLLGYVVKALQELSAENKNLKKQIDNFRKPM